MHEVEASITVAGKQETITLEVRYVFVPKDDGIGHQPEITSVRAPIAATGETLDMEWMLSNEQMQAILNEIEEI
jgi:hypothetical protein